MLGSYSKSNSKGSHVHFSYKYFLGILMQIASLCQHAQSLNIDTQSFPVDSCLCKLSLIAVIPCDNMKMDVLYKQIVELILRFAIKPDATG